MTGIDYAHRHASDQHQGLHYSHLRQLTVRKCLNILPPERHRRSESKVNPRRRARTLEPVRDMRALRLTPDALLQGAPQLDVLHIPGGYGQEELMGDESVLSWVRTQATGAKCLFSVCTGALICGAAGLLVGRRATTHWSALHLLPFFGATPVNERVVADGNLVCAAGVTAGIDDGALRVAARLRGDEVAHAIRLYMVYALEPPFNSGSPETAPVAVLEQARLSARAITERRERTARRAAARLGIDPNRGEASGL
jgi:cyclohexyl-isocyanide hydratase